MAYGVKYVPLMPPGAPSRSEPENVSTYDRLSKYKMLSKLNNEQAAEAKIKLQAIMKEIEAERERDMAITSPTQPLFYMPPTIRPDAPTTPVDPHVYYDTFNASSYASTSSAPFSFDALHYLPPLDTNFNWQPTPGLEFLDQDFSFDLPPLTDDMDCSSSSGSAEDEDLDDQLQQMISSLPDGRIPSEDWTTSYPELNELIAASTQDQDLDGLDTFTPSFELPEYITEAIHFQDEAFRKSLDADFEAAIASMPMLDTNASTPVPTFLQEGIVTEEPTSMETDSTESSVI